MKTIAVISQKGGAGKTTVVVHLATAAERLGFRAAVFDLDPQASATLWADKRVSDTPTVIAAQAARIPNLMQQAQTQFADLVLMDSAPNADATSLAAARSADMILIPCRPAAFDLTAIGATLNLASVANKPAWVLLNAVPPQGRLGEEAALALRKEGVQVVPVRLHQRAAYAHSVNDGRTAQEYEPKSTAAEEIRTLFKWLQRTLDLKPRLRANTPTNRH